MEIDPLVGLIHTFLVRWRYILQGNGYIHFQQDGEKSSSRMDTKIFSKDRSSSGTDTYIFSMMEIDPQVDRIHVFLVGWRKILKWDGDNLFLAGWRQILKWDGYIHFQQDRDRSSSGTDPCIFSRIEIDPQVGRIHVFLVGWRQILKWDGSMYFQQNGDRSSSWTDTFSFSRMKINPQVGRIHTFLVGWRQYTTN